MTASPVRVGERAERVPDELNDGEVVVSDNSLKTVYHTRLDCGTVTQLSRRNMRLADLDELDDERWEKCEKCQRATTNLSLRDVVEEGFGGVVYKNRGTAAHLYEDCRDCPDSHKEYDVAVLYGDERICATCAMRWQED